MILRPVQLDLLQCRLRQEVRLISLHQTRLALLRIAVVCPLILPRALEGHPHMKQFRLLVALHLNRCYYH